LASRNLRASPLRNFCSSEKSKFISAHSVFSAVPPSFGATLRTRRGKGKIDLASRISGSYDASLSSWGRAWPRRFSSANQKVWVESVGAWAVIEKIVPVWAKGFDEPVRVTYDVGLGREFQGHELRAELDEAAADAAEQSGPWRLMRARNKWQSEEDCARHPYPGTYPVIVTDDADWGGWRVPGARVRSGAGEDRTSGQADRQRAPAAGSRKERSRNWWTRAPAMRRPSCSASPRRSPSLTGAFVRRRRRVPLPSGPRWGDRLFGAVTALHLRGCVPRHAPSPVGYRRVAITRRGTTTRQGSDGAEAP
jgi:hypothetical protein